MFIKTFDNKKKGIIVGFFGGRFVTPFAPTGFRLEGSMNLTRRQFIALMSSAAVAGLLPRASFATGEDVYDFHFSGNVRLLHFTDCHAQLMPIYFREPNANIGIGEASGRVPHLVGTHLLKRYPQLTGAYAHALTYLNFTESERRYGKVGGFAHLATLVKQLRAAAGENRTLLLDGGDTWQGSGTAYWTRGRDMVGACNLLGVDVMTGHWEFTYHADEVMQRLKRFNGDFVAQNVFLTEEGLFDGKPVYDEPSGHVFPPYVIKDMGGVRVAVIGQAYPYTPISNPKRFIPDWTFGIRETVLPGQAITMEHVLDQTCMTYPQTYATEMTGQQLKLIFEDVCDNLFNTDPYLQQGGDMVRVTGMNYVCDPTARIGHRITDMQLDNGDAIEAGKRYKVSGWATVGSQSPGAPVWDVVADYLRDKKVASVKKLNTPKLINIDNNLGWST